MFNFKKIKKLKIILFIFIIFNSMLGFKSLSFSKEASIASFNTLRLGKANKDYKLMSEVLQEFDLVGLIEVMNREGIEKLVDTLNKNTDEKWEYLLSPYPVGRGAYKEYFGYIWKRDKVTMLKAEGFYPDKLDKFSRAPFGAKFKIGNFTFTFVLVHIVFGKHESPRRAEIFRLIDVYEYFKIKNIKTKSVLLGGDFNMSAYDEAFDILYSSPDAITCGINPKIRTTLGKNSLASSYDNIFLSKKYTKQFTGKGGALDFTNKKYRELKNKISDHLPVFIIVNIE